MSTGYDSSSARLEAGAEKAATDLTNVTQKAMHDAAALADTAKHDLAELGAEAKSQVAKIGDEVMGHAGAIGEEAKAQLGKAAEQVKGFAAEQKDFVSGQISGIADALDRVATQLRGENAPAAGTVRLVADQARSVTDAVKNKDVDQILAMAQEFGRKQPVAFMGVALLAGFAASRFVGASAQRAQKGSMSSNAATVTDYEPWMEPRPAAPAPRPTTGYNTTPGYTPASRYTGGAE